MLYSFIRGIPILREVNSLTKKRTAIVGGIVGLVVCITILVLLDLYGVWYLFPIGHSDLRVILWPSSVMLTVGWRTSVPGVLITLSSIAINCMVYALAALVLHVSLGQLKRRAQ